MNVASFPRKRSSTPSATAPSAPVIARGLWPTDLPPPVFAADNEVLMRAVSLLVSMPTRDGERVSSRDIRVCEARDLVAWAK